MVKEIKGRFGKVLICDNMNKKYGLPSLEDKSFDLCLTDPPYDNDFNVSYSNIKLELKAYKIKKDNKIHFNDSFENYEKFSRNWFNVCSKKVNGIVFTCGIRHHYDWIRWIKPNYCEKYHYKSNLCSYIKLEPILFYGKVKNIINIRQVIDIPINLNKELKTIHSSPKSFYLWEYIIEKLKPKSVIDIFSGSGTTFEVCESLGIKYLGYEINEDYIPDIEKRIKNGMKKYKERKIITQKGLI